MSYKLINNSTSLYLAMEYQETFSEASMMVLIAVKWSYNLFQNTMLWIDLSTDLNATQ